MLSHIKLTDNYCNQNGSGTVLKRLVSENTVEAD